ncbi:hypothetical protein [Sinorhizobium fredii]|uniref:hypothetical protein n=1 Tax=Rhizobium fredii TaxID=380 RepID=UPI0021087A93|nr:hypothetical protein [Sinorhizobium fredii]UTY46689.1 hypothetical protein EPK84_07430 [Sinorhizobium fredii]
MEERKYFRKERTPLEPVHLFTSQVPTNLSEAYGGIREVVSADPSFGTAWKLGGTTATTQRIFNVDKLYFGALHKCEVAVLPARAPTFPTFELKGEAEIAIRIAPSAMNLLEGETAIRSALPSALFDSWCVALELPSSPIGNLVECGLLALVADRCAAGFLALGRAREIDDAIDWTSSKIRIEQNGEVIASGGADALVWTPDECGRAFLLEALAQGFKPKPGQWISTGGATPCVPYNRGAEISVFYNDNEELRFIAGSEV